MIRARHGGGVRSRINRRDRTRESVMPDRCEPVVSAAPDHQEPCSKADRMAAGDRDGRTRYIGASGVREKDHETGNFVRLSGATERNVGVAAVPISRLRPPSRLRLWSAAATNASPRSD